MFSTPEFIQASRDFVCIRIETYENKESEKMVRELLNGRFANTAFCIFNPSGTRRLSRAGRSPKDLIRSRGNNREEPSNEGIVKELNRISNRYESTTTNEAIVLQDFQSFRQALNVSAADQRLLVFLNASPSTRKTTESTLAQVFADDDVTGKFHLDLSNTKTDKDWYKKIEGAKKGSSSIVIIQASKFGLDGKILASLSLDSEADVIKDSLLKANKGFGGVEERKTYSQHVLEGKRKGVYFENEIPYGEDRDGDGKADSPQQLLEQRRRRGK